MYVKLGRPFFGLAPMYDVTDTVFRQIIAGTAKPDYFVTEFVNVDGLQSEGRPRLMKRLLRTSGEGPVVAQIWGMIPENFYKTAQELVDMGFAGIDINMGCPDRTIVKKGCCSGLIHHRDLAVEIIKATQAGAEGRVPVSVKTRLGFSQIDLTWHELLLEQHLDVLTVHGRVTRQMSRGEADWETIGQIRTLRDKISPTTLLVGNGDVMSRHQGEELAARYGLDGVLIGRGVFHDPYVFAQESPWESMTPKERIQLYLQQVKLFAITWQSNERPIATLNRFCKIYVNGFDGAKELRDQLMAATTTDQLIGLLNDALVRDYVLLPQ